MKTKLLLLLAFAFISCTASKDEQGEELCDCTLEHYLYVPNVGSSGGEYRFIFAEPLQFECEAQWGDYYPVSNINYNYDRVNCN